MAKVRLHPLFKYIRGTIKGMVFRLSHNGKLSAYLSPNMSRVEWSQAQDAHRERMAEAFAYASQATRDPVLKEHYLRMALREKKNNRPYDMAVSDYFHNRNNLLGDRFYWSAAGWRAKYEERKRKRMRKKHW
jgi:hypothetical protein